MKAFVAIGLGMLGLWYFLAGGRSLSAADLPALRQLYLVKGEILRQVALCIERSKPQGSILSASQLAGAIAGLGTFAASLNFKTALAAGRKVASASGGYIDAKPVKCVDIAPLITLNDEISARLELDPALSQADVSALAARFGGFDNRYSGPVSKAATGPQDVPDNVPY